MYAFQLKSNVQSYDSDIHSSSKVLDAQSVDNLLRFRPFYCKRLTVTRLSANHIKSTCIVPSTALFAPPHLKKHMLHYIVQPSTYCLLLFLTDFLLRGQNSYGFRNLTSLKED